MPQKWKNQVLWEKTKWKTEDEIAWSERKRGMLQEMMEKGA